MMMGSFWSYAWEIYVGRSRLPFGPAAIEVEVHNCVVEIWRSREELMDMFLAL